MSNDERSTCSGNILVSFDLTKCLENANIRDGEEQFSLRVAICSKKIEHMTEMLDRNKSAVALIDAKPLRRNFKCFSRFSEDAIDGDMSPVRPSFEAELEKKKSEAQHRLGLLFRFGKCDLCDSASRAVQIYEQALDDGNMDFAFSLELCS